VIRPHLLWLVVALVYVAGAPQAGAEPTITFYGGNQLWEYCRSDSPDLVCLSYTSGVADAMAANREGVLGWHACFRPNTTRGQIADVVKLWLKNHPEKRDFEAAGLVAEALQRAFPCSP
jgi:hypothetical protein